VINSSLTRLAEIRAQSRVATPVIILAKPGRLGPLIETVKNFDLSKFIQEDRILPRFREKVPVPETLGQSFIKLNMISAFMAREDIFDLAEDPDVEKIFPDEEKFAFSESPPGTFNFKGKIITSTFFSKKVIGADIANNAGYLGRGIRVTIVDTGASRTHEALINRVEIKRTLPQLRDEVGHGTWVTACIGGKLAIDDATSRLVGERIPTEGMAPEVELTSVKSLGFGIGIGTDGSILGGIEIALENGSKVLSMSLGGDVPEETQKPEEDVYFEAMIKAEEQGLIPVIAAGNSGPEPGSVTSPGWLPNVLTVGAFSTFDGKVPDFSGRGPTKDGRIKPDIVAPGVNIDAPLVGVLDLTDKLIQRYGAISGTCTPLDTMVGKISMKELIVGDIIPSIWGKDLVLAKWYQGINIVFRVITEDGIEFEATSEHKILVWSNKHFIWKPLISLHRGDEIVDGKMSNMWKEFQNINSTLYQNPQNDNSGIQNQISRSGYWYLTTNFPSPSQTLEQRKEITSKPKTITRNEKEMEQSKLSKEIETERNANDQIWHRKSILWKTPYRGIKKEDVKDEKRKIFWRSRKYEKSIKESSRPNYRSNKKPTTQRISLCSNPSLLTNSGYSSIKKWKNYFCRSRNIRPEKISELPLSSRNLTHKIKKIIKIGKKPVYDITTLSHTFSANGIIVHNSMATPHSSGLIALMAESKRKLVGDELTLGEIMDMMEQLGKKKNNQTGFGSLTWNIWTEWLSTQYGISV